MNQGKIKMTEQEKEFLEGINSILYDNTPSFIDSQKRIELSEMILDLNKRIYPQITKKPVKVFIGNELSGKLSINIPNSCDFNMSDCTKYIDDHYVEVSDD